MEKIDTNWKTKKLKSLAKLFKPFNRDWAPLTYTKKIQQSITDALSRVTWQAYTKADRSHQINVQNIAEFTYKLAIIFKALLSSYF